MSIFFRSISDANPVFRHINDFADHALNEIRDTWPSFLPSVSGSDLLWSESLNWILSRTSEFRSTEGRIIQKGTGSQLSILLARKIGHSCLHCLRWSSCQSWGELEISVKRKLGAAS